LPFAQRFADRAFKRQGKAFERFTAEAEAFLAAYPWPGNVRELKNSMERLAILQFDGCVDRADLAFLDMQTRRDAPPPPVGLAGGPFTLPDEFFDLEGFTRSVIRQALLKFSGNQRKVAEYLGLSRRQLQGRIKKWGLK
ncbi:MAG: hypothetical protein IH612_10870, partial [Desulfofustis sp.]|nr:hypothetical protein [Desulfofustis sp.]